MFLHTAMIFCSQKLFSDHSNHWGKFDSFLILPDSSQRSCYKGRDKHRLTADGLVFKQKQFNLIVINNKKTVLQKIENLKINLQN